MIGPQNGGRSQLSEIEGNVIRVAENLEHLDNPSQLYAWEKVFQIHLWTKPLRGMCWSDLSI